MESSQSQKDSFIEWLKTGTKQPVSDGGFLLPITMTSKTRGIKGWFYRLIKDSRGYYEVNICDLILGKAHGK